MKKIYLLIICWVTIFGQSSLAAIDERLSDIYFANGVGAITYLNSFKQGWEQVIIYEVENPDKVRWIGKYDLAFNTGHGLLRDFFEAWLQFTDENPSALVTWSAFKEMVARSTLIGGGAIGLSEAVTRTYEAQDLVKQVEKYKRSIREGHGVLVLAHSQGNFFTNKAYAQLSQGPDSWMKDFFITVGLASPSSDTIPHSFYVTYDNDPIVALNGAGTVIDNPMRYYFWIAGPNVPVDHTSTVPCAPSALHVGATPYCHDPDWSFQESEYTGFHDFDYYMEGNATKSDIFSHMSYAINFQNSVFRPSQWVVDQEFYKGTRNYRITVKNQFDPNITMYAKVFPFAVDKKLYQVDGEWVKGGHTGEKILDFWPGQLDHEAFLLSGTGEIITIELFREITGRYVVKTCRSSGTVMNYYSRSGWQSWCGSGSATNAFINSWDWIVQTLPPCTDTGSEEILDSEVPLNAVLMKEEIVSEESVVNGTYHYGMNAHYIPGSGRCTSGIFGKSSFRWVADVYDGYTDTTNFKRVYRVH